jgi:hypothetical protein
MQEQQRPLLGGVGDGDPVSPLRGFDRFERRALAVQVVVWKPLRGAELGAHERMGLLV